MTQIQWYPGHMAKALRQAKEQLKLVDVVLELVDARLPESSQNPKLAELIGAKPKIMVLTKADMADPKATKQFCQYFEQQHIPTVALNTNSGNLKPLLSKIKQVAQPIIVHKKERGIDDYKIKLMCIGIPNVGKSTLLNQLVAKRVANVGNRPGVTKAQQWLKARNHFLLLDTPGILWPKFEDPLVGKKLALTGAIKDTLYAKDDVALYALEHLVATNPESLKRRYRLSDADIADTTVNLLLKITKQMGMKEDYERASERLIFEVRKQKLGPITLDMVPQAPTAGGNQ